VTSPLLALRALWRGSIRTQLIVTNILVLALLLLALGGTVSYTVHGTMMNSVDRELDSHVRRYIDPPPAGRRPGGRWALFFQHHPEELAQGRDDRRDNGRDRQPDGPGRSGNGPHSPQNGKPDQGMPPWLAGAQSPQELQRRQREINPFQLSLFDRDTTPISLFGESAPVLDAAALKAARTQHVIRSIVLLEGKRTRILTRAVPATGPTLGYVQAPYTLTDVDNATSWLDRTLCFLSPVALLFAGFGGALLTDRMLRRVQTMSRAAGRIGADDLAARLPVTGADEFSQLATTFNGLLGRVETAFRAQERLIEMQRRFTADASHELKTPLTTIKGTASMALASPLSPELFRQSLVEIDRAAGTMSHLVQDLLLLAHADDGRAGEDRIEMLLREVLELAMPPRTPGIPAAPITLRIADESLTLLGNETELVRLFRNLLDNAVRYTPPTGTVTATARREGTNAVITITDTGPGIAPEHLPHLGERFYRVDASRARPDGGTGLGISISQSIAEGHGGTVTFESMVGVGTTARVVLPAG
jgi:signal transduction histidine kinase